jgi:hypothetical protein
MHVSCKNCLHFKKVPGQMSVFCKMNKLPKVEISRCELGEDGLIELVHRRLFDSAESCPMFVNMEDEEEGSRRPYSDIGGSCLAS